MTCCKWRSGVPTSKTQCRWIPLGHLFKTCGLQSADYMCNQTTTPTPETCSFKPENLGFNIFWKFLYCCVFSSSQITSPFFFFLKNIGLRFFFSGIKYKYTGGYGMQVQNFFFFTEKQWKSGTLIACRCTNLSDLMFDGLRVIPPITSAAETYREKKD